MDTSLIPDVRRIAVLRANALGDFIFTLPALDALRAAYPAAEIVLLGRAWHADFLAGRPGPVDRVVRVPGDGEPDAMAGRRFGDAPWLAAGDRERRHFERMMRAEHFDLAVQMHGGGRNSNPFVRSLGATVSIGLRSPDAPALDRWVRYVYYQHEILRGLEVAALAGAGPRELQSRIALTDHDRDDAATVLAGVQKPFIAMHPGAVDPRRRWPVERFAAVADALAGDGYSIVLTGVSSDAALTAGVSRAMRRPAHDLAGATSLSGLAGVLATARLVVSNDSGPLHLAAALGVPAVGIYWCGNVINGGPLFRAKHRPAISWQLSCPVCGVDCTRGRCPHEESFVADVTTDEVLAQACDLLDADGGEGDAGADGTLAHGMHRIG